VNCSSNPVISITCADDKPGVNYVPSGNALCDRNTAQVQRYYYKSLGVVQGYMQVQSLAWERTSRFDIWDDNLPHSIVLSLPGTPQGCFTSWRLSVIFDGPFVSSTAWICTPTSPYHTQFIFELIEDSTSVPGALLGSVYRIWVANTQWCLLDRALQDDEAYMYRSTPTTSLVALELFLPQYNPTVDMCGLFVVQDNVIRVLQGRNANKYVGRNGLGNPDFISATPPPTITTPPSYLDTVSSTPLPWPVACRSLPCQLPVIRASGCRTSQCARTFFVSNAIFQLCLSCLKAHTLLDAD